MATTRITRGQKRKLEQLNELAEKIDQALEDLDPGIDASVIKLPFRDECPACHSKEVYACCKGRYSTLRCDSWHLWWPYSSKILTKQLLEPDYDDDPPEERVTCSRFLYFGPENWKVLQLHRIDGILANLEKLKGDLQTIRAQTHSLGSVLPA